MLDCVVPSTASTALLPVKRPQPVDLTQALQDNEGVDGITRMKHVSSCPVSLSPSTSPQPPSTPSTTVQTNIQKFQQFSIKDNLPQIQPIQDKPDSQTSAEIQTEGSLTPTKTGEISCEGENDKVLGSSPKLGTSALAASLGKSPVVDLVEPKRVAKVMDTCPKDKKEMTPLCKMRGGNRDPNEYEQVSCVKVMSMSPTRGDGFAYLHTYRFKKREE